MSEIFELRQYTHHPEKRETLIELFEREFYETQEACGMRLIGQFRDRDDADHFVWFRGFPDMERRKEALTCFYSGPVWKQHRDAANATLIDSDDVLLLRLVDGFAFPPVGRVSHIAVYSFDRPIDHALLALVRAHVPALTLLQTEESENNYPQLPVRAGEHVIVALTEDAPPRDLGTGVKVMRVERTKRSRL